MVWSASFGFFDRRIVTTSDDHTARLFDAETGQELRVLAGHRGNINSASFSVDGRRIVTASEDRTMRLWDAETGQELHVLAGHESRLLALGSVPTVGAS